MTEYLWAEILKCGKNILALETVLSNCDRIHDDIVRAQIRAEQDKLDTLLAVTPS